VALQPVVIISAAMLAGTARNRALVALAIFVGRGDATQDAMLTWLKARLKASLHEHLVLLLLLHLKDQGRLVRLGQGHGRQLGRKTTQGQRKGRLNVLFAPPGLSELLVRLQPRGPWLRHCPRRPQWGGVAFLSIANHSVTSRECS